MSLLTCLTAFALVGLLAATPVDEDVVTKIILSKNFYTKDYVIHKAEHDIVKLILPVNTLNNPPGPDRELHVFLFFVEGDIQADGSLVDQGLYVLNDGKAKKILDNGRDATTSRAYGSNKAFFGAKDGPYVYNQETNSADKYGPITDSIIAIEATGYDDIIYILTEDREVFKVTDNGEKKEKLADVVNAKDIILDYEDNLYFYDDNKKLYVRTADGIKIIEGLPASTGNVFLYNPLDSSENCVQVLINNELYLMYPNGTSKRAGLEYEPDAVPTAQAAESTVVQYYAFNKEIYEYNLLTCRLLSKISRRFRQGIRSKSMTTNEEERVVKF